MRLYTGLRESAKATVDNLTADAERATQHHFADLNLIEHNYGASSFLLACQRGDLIEVEKYLLQANNSNDHDPSSSNSSSSNTAIAGDGHNGQSIKTTSIAELVASVDCRGVSPLLAASGNGHIEVVKVLLSHGASLDVCASDGAHPLFAAAQGGHTDICRALLEEAAATKSSASYEGAAGVESLINRLGNEGGWSPCLVASWYGHVNALEVLLEHGADRFQPSTAPFQGLSRNATPLMAANAQGHTAIAALLQQQDQEQSPLPSSQPATSLSLELQSDAHSSPAQPVELSNGTNESHAVPVPALEADNEDVNSCDGSGHRERLLAFYAQHEPSKMAQVDKLLVKYHGREEGLWSQLEAKYGRNELTSPPIEAFALDGDNEGVKEAK